jgi:hypothetical protein
MTNCDDISTVMADLSTGYGWTCIPVPNRNDILEVSTGRTWHDAEPLVLMVRVDDGSTIVASDGGRTLLRLRDAGFEMDEAVFTTLWNEALRAYRIRQLDDRLFVQADMGMAAEAVARLADAMLAIEGLRVVCIPRQERGRSLADEVEEYLRVRPGITAVHKSPVVSLAQGLTIRPSMTVDTNVRQGVLLQTGATSSRTQAYDHAFTTFGLADRGRVPMEKRLTVLGGRAETWTPGRLRALSEVTFVGFWAHRDLVTQFLTAKRVPDDPILVPSGTNIPLL